MVRQGFSLDLSLLYYNPTDRWPPIIFHLYINIRRHLMSHETHLFQFSLIYCRQVFIKVIFDKRDWGWSCCTNCLCPSCYNSWLETNIWERTLFVLCLIIFFNCCNKEFGDLQANVHDSFGRLNRQFTLLNKS